MRIPALFLILMLTAVSMAAAAGTSKPIDVTSQQMETLEKGKIVLFHGNVKVVQDTGTLLADTVRQYIAEDRLEAEGNVHYREVKDQETTDLYGDKMTYDRKTGYGKVTGQPKMVRAIAGKPDELTTITGDLIEFFNQEKRAKVTGQAVIDQVNSKSKSDLADYYYDTRKLVLTGNPWVWQKDENNTGEYTGKTITMFTDTKNVIINEDVIAKITPVKKEKTDKK
jgi:lipopolysaccharide transport protein LptA